MDDKLRASVAIALVTVLAGSSVLVVLSEMKPVAEAGSDLFADVGEVVQFDASGSSYSDRYYWNFRDNTWSELGSSPTHAYQSEGVYEVGLVVEAWNGKQDLDTVKVTVKNMPPVLPILDDATVLEDSPLEFDASDTSDSAIDIDTLNYVWHFGDGTITEDGPVVNHTYRDAGQYTAMLAVTDNQGAISLAMKNVTVTSVEPTVEMRELSCLEGDSVLVEAHANDTPSDIESLRYNWDNGKHGSVALLSFDEQGYYHPSVEVIDNEGLTTRGTTTVVVQDEAPITGITDALITGTISLRASGEKWHDLRMSIQRSDVEQDSLTIYRVPGGPNVQEGRLPNYTFDLGGSYKILIAYTPENDPINGQVQGATPAWFEIDFGDGSPESVYQSFNVQQPEEWNWTIYPGSFFLDREITLGGFAYDAGNDAVSTTWNLGNGATKSYAHLAGGAPNFFMESVKAAFSEGTYTITLTAQDDDGGLSSFETTLVASDTEFFVSNLAPKASISGQFLAIEEEEQVRFYGVAQGGAGQTLEFAWRFGDGERADGPSPSHAFVFEGDYNVALFVRDSSNDTGVAVCRVAVANIAPQAAIEGLMSSPKEDSEVTVKASVLDTSFDKAQASCHWSFGDGAEGFGVEARHTYDQPGDYEVTLVVEDNDGSLSKMNTTIRVNNVVPGVRFSSQTVYGNVTDASLTAYAIDTISDISTLTYFWNFSDGTTDVGQFVKHSYYASGAYGVQLTVTDVHNASGTFSGTVLVSIDRDGDGLSSEEEVVATTSDTAPDSDGDDLVDYFEIYTFETDPTKYDSDDDLLNDWYEVAYFGYNEDTDLDGLMNPMDPDSDEDGMIDGTDSQPLIFTGPDNLDYSTVTVFRDLNGTGFDVIVALDFESDYAMERASAGPSRIIGTEGVGFGPVFNVTLPESLQEHDFRSCIEVRYPEAALTGVREDKLALFEYDDWMTTNRTGVNTTTNIVWGVVDNYSIAYQAGDIEKIDSDRDGLSDLRELATLYRLDYQTDDAYWGFHWGQKTRSASGICDFDSFVVSEYGRRLAPVEDMMPEWDADRDWNLQLPWTPYQGSDDWYTVTSARYHSGQFSYGIDGTRVRGDLMSPDFVLPVSQSGNLVLRFWMCSSNYSGLDGDSFSVRLEYASGFSVTESQSIAVTNSSEEWKQVELTWIPQASFSIESVTIDFSTDFTGPSFGYPGQIEGSGFVYLDDVELLMSLNPHNNDTDQDGLTDGQEVIQYLTNPILWDTDSDRLGDYSEVYGEYGYFTDPTQWDTDVDGLGDGFEVFNFGSDPTKQDTDNDSLNDRIEYAYGTDPCVDGDKDGDNLSDAMELNGSLGYVLDVNCSDSDHDNLTDGDEVLVYGTDPTRPDTDLDGTSDGDEVLIWHTDPFAWTGTDYDHDGLLNDEEYNGTYGYVTNATNRDTDSDGLQDYQEIFPVQGSSYCTDPTVKDTDGDGLSDWEEEFTGLDGYFTLPLVPDTDADGLMDGEEYTGWNVYVIKTPAQFNSVMTYIENGWAPEWAMSVWHVRSSPVTTDTDNDNLADFAEMTARSDPRDKDTDDDNYEDGYSFWYEGAFEAEDPSIFEWIEPEISGYGEKPSWSFDVILTWQVEDRGGLATVEIYKNNERIYFLNLTAIAAPGERYTGASGTTMSGIGFFDAFNAANFWVRATDVYGNSADYNLLTVGTLFQAVGTWVATNIPLIGPKLGGEIVGAMRSFSELITEPIYILTHLSSVYESARDIGEKLRTNGTQGLIEVLRTMIDGIVAIQEEDNPFDSGTPEYSQYSTGWYLGYVAGIILTAMVGGSGAVTKAETMLSKIAKGVSELADAITHLKNPLRLLKFGKASLALSILKISGVAAAMYAAAELIPEVFGKWFDQGFACAFIIVSLAGIATFSPEVQKLFPEIARLAGSKLNVNQLATKIHGWFPDAANADEAVISIYNLRNVQGWRKAVQEIAQQSDSGRLMEFITANRIGAERIEGLSTPVFRPGVTPKQLWTDIDITLRADATHNRALCSVKTGAFNNFKDELALELPAYRFADPAADIVVYVKGIYVTEVQNYIAALNLGYTVSVRSLP